MNEKNIHVCTVYLRKNYFSSWSTFLSEKKKASTDRYAVHLQTKINDNKMIFEFQKQDDWLTINEVEIAAFEHQLTNYSNPMTHSLKFKFKNLKKVYEKVWNSHFLIFPWKTKVGMTIQ